MNSPPLTRKNSRLANQTGLGAFGALQGSMMINPFDNSSPSHMGGTNGMMQFNMNPVVPTFGKTPST